MRKLLWVLASFALGSQCLAAAPSRPIDRAAEILMLRGWPGVGLLAEEPDGKVEIATRGMASIENRTPITTATGFHMCSINKTFTSVAIMRLVDQGKLSLDQKVTAILDQQVVKRIPNIEQITIRQLLDHSSGIYPTNNDPSYVRTLVGEEAFTKHVWRLEEMVELATRSENKPVAKPGEGHHYSDTNYILLGMIIERLSGETYKAHITRTILQPLGMSDTYFYSDVLQGQRETAPTVANGYIKLTKDVTDAVKFNSQFAQPRPGWINVSIAAERVDPAAGLITTLPDLRKFADALFRGKLLSERSQVVETSVLGEITTAKVGQHLTRALQAAQTAFGPVVYKEGDGPGGFNTFMAFHPKTGTIFIGFTNQFGNFDEVEAMMNDGMRIVVDRETQPAIISPH